MMITLAVDWRVFAELICGRRLPAESRLDVLVNNAGCFYCPPSLTEDGFTVTFQTNYLGKQPERTADAGTS